MKRKLMLIVFSLSVISAGCNLFGKDDSSSPTTSTITGDASTADKADVEQALSSDEFFSEEMSDMLDEDESMMEMSIGLIDTALPIAESHQHWRRHRTGLASINKSFEFGRNGDTSYCTVTVTRNITGILLVDTTRDAVKNPGEKPFADTACRN